MTKSSNPSPQYYQKSFSLFPRTNSSLFPHNTAGHSFLKKTILALVLNFNLLKP